MCSLSQCAQIRKKLVKIEEKSIGQLLKLWAKVKKVLISANKNIALPQQMFYYALEWP